MANNFIRGAGYLWQGFRLLMHPSVIPFVILPILLNIVIYYFLVDSLYQFGSTKIETWLNVLPEWLSALKNLIKVLFIALIVVVVAFTFSTFATFLGAPFYGLLAEKVVFIKTGETPAMALNWQGLLKIIPRTLIRETQKLSYYLLRVIPLLILWAVGFVLVFLQPIVSLLWFIFSAKLLAIQYTDYAFDNDEIPFSRMKQTLSKVKLTTLGFGSITQFCLMIPFVSIIVVPTAVCGATLLYCDELKNLHTNAK